jgi:hypothetical protein
MAVNAVQSQYNDLPTDCSHLPFIIITSTLMNLLTICFTTSLNMRMTRHVVSCGISLAKPCPCRVEINYQDLFSEWVSSKMAFIQVIVDSDLHVICSNVSDQ